ncbi:MAG UNVERIFIED_CONTAM: hypothetical protein LVR18_47385 [Planctomycetaceae bacterium]|jgi:hypothetical protein
MELEEYFRGTVRERVVGYFAALLYAVVCSHLEQGLSQPLVLASVVRRLEELK